MRIAFEPSTLHKSKMGAVTGVVYFDFGPEQRFPVAGWNDFVVVVAGWWLAALSQITRTGGENVLRFMDGPYWITVIPQECSKLLLRCTEDRRGAGVVQSTTVDLDEFEREINGFARAVSLACAAAGVESADLENLRSLLPN
ncbi:hypothetical protein [Sorangium cellulosum]|uniref:hypothetical protein n=1 Tax=Sorangium cellulosum TaxID=56 RepID=UPI000AD5F598|nr:hypothetical protein [Sorangium cellulosum]